MKKPLRWAVVSVLFLQAIMGAPLFALAPHSGFGPAYPDKKREFIISDRRYTVEKTIGKDQHLLYRLSDEKAHAVVVVDPVGFKIISFLVQGDETLNYAHDFIPEGIPVEYPFTGRIQGGKFTREGVEHILPKVDDKGNAIGGLVKDKTWTVEQIDADEEGIFIKGFLDTSDFPETAKDFGLSRVTLTYRLKDNALVLDSVIHNKDNKPLPLHLRYHPWFRVQTDATVIRPFKARKRYENESTMPKQPVAISDTMEFMPLEGKLDHTFLQMQPDGDDFWTVIAQDMHHHRQIVVRGDAKAFPCVGIWDGWGDNLSIEPGTAVPNAMHRGEQSLMAAGEKLFGRVTIEMHEIKDEEVLALAAETTAGTLLHHVGNFTQIFSPDPVAWDETEKELQASCDRTLRGLNRLDAFLSDIQKIKNPEVRQQTVQDEKGSAYAFFDVENSKARERLFADPIAPLQPSARLEIQVIQGLVSIFNDKFHDLKAVAKRIEELRDRRDLELEERKKQLIQELEAVNKDFKAVHTLANYLVMHWQVQREQGQMILRHYLLPNNPIVVRMPSGRSGALKNLGASDLKEELGQAAAEKEITALRQRLLKAEIKMQKGRSTKPEGWELAHKILEELLGEVLHGISREMDEHKRPFEAPACRIALLMDDKQFGIGKKGFRIGETQHYLHAYHFSDPHTGQIVFAIPMSYLQGLSEYIHEHTPSSLGFEKALRMACREVFGHELDEGIQGLTHTLAVLNEIPEENLSYRMRYDIHSMTAQQREALLCRMPRVMAEISKKDELTKWERNRVRALAMKVALEAAKENGVVGDAFDFLEAAITVWFGSVGKGHHDQLRALDKLIRDVRSMEGNNDALLLPKWPGELELFRRDGHRILRMGVYRWAKEGEQTDFPGYVFVPASDKESREYGKEDFLRDLMGPDVLRVYVAARMAAFANPQWREDLIPALTRWLGYRRSTIFNAQVQSTLAVFKVVSVKNLMELLKDSKDPQESKDRIKSRRMQAAEALAEMRDTAKEAVPLLLGGLHSDELDIRKIFAVALRQIDPENPAPVEMAKELIRDSFRLSKENQNGIQALQLAGIDILGSYKSEDKDEAPRLVEIKRQQSIAAFRELYHQLPNYVRYPDDRDYPKFIAAATWAMMDPSAMETIEVLMLWMDNEPHNATYSVAALQHMGEPASWALKDALKDPVRRVRACHALQEMGRFAEKAVPDLVMGLEYSESPKDRESPEDLREREGRVRAFRSACAQALAKLGPALIARKLEETPQGFENASNAFAQAGMGVIPALLDALQNRREVVRRFGETTLVKMGAIAVEEILEWAAKEQPKDAPQPDVTAVARRIILQIGSKALPRLLVAAKNSNQEKLAASLLEALGPMEQAL